jgi:hypothetical protein
MSNANKVDLDFIAGARSDAHDVNPYIWSSNAWLMWEAGRLWVTGGRSEPVMARKSRGYTARVNTHAMAYVIKFTGDALTPSVERI